ncbi:MAG TPA: cation diffusion facilitator family transporter [Terriglobia bacterium]|nr:cation diffusion facilitator family transporter [Terriglobia bacterium]
MRSSTKIRIGKRVALVSIAVSVILALVKITVGVVGRSASVLADGVESAGDVVAATAVFFGFAIASRPADEEHPYGHGRYETLTGLVVGFILFVAGIGICYRSLQGVDRVHQVPAFYGIWALAASMIAKTIMSAVKFHYGKKIHSAGLTADAWNDFVDILSAVTALTALGLTLLDPERFLVADSYGGFAVGLFVIFTGVRVAKDTSSRLTDEMPDDEMMSAIREASLTVPGAVGVEKCFARNVGLQYYVDLHLEVDPDLTVRKSHDIATEVRFAIRRKLDWVADVLVHVEPAPDAPQPVAPGHSRTGPAQSPD